MPIINSMIFGGGEVEDLVGTLTFKGDSATSTYFTESGCSLAVDPIREMAFLTLQGGTSTSYENIFYDVEYIMVPDGVTFLPTQLGGWVERGDTQSYFTAVFTGVKKKINVSVRLDDAARNSSYDFITPSITMTYADEE